MATASAPQPSWRDGVALSLDQASLAWMNADIHGLLAIARLQPNDSVLVIGCGTAGLAIEAVKVLGPGHGRIVGIDPSRGMIQQAVIKLETLNMSDDIGLYRGDVTQLNSIADFHNTSQAQSPPIFDTLFACNVLPIELFQAEAALRHWSAYLTPQTGRMVVTFCPSDTKNAHLAGVQCVFQGDQVMARVSFMLEDEWVQAERAFNDLASSVGLRVEGMQRVSFHGEVHTQIGDVMEERARLAFANTTDKDLSWVNADGTFTPAFKREYLMQSLEMTGNETRDTVLHMLDGIEGLGPRGQAMREQMRDSLAIVPVPAKLAAILH